MPAVPEPPRQRQGRADDDGLLAKANGHANGSGSEVDAELRGFLAGRLPPHDSADWGGSAG